MTGTEPVQVQRQSTMERSEGGSSDRRKPSTMREFTSITQIKAPHQQRFIEANGQGGHRSTGAGDSIHRTSVARNAAAGRGDRPIAQHRDAAQYIRGMTGNRLKTTACRATRRFCMKPMRAGRVDGRKKMVVSGNVACNGLLRRKITQIPRLCDETAWVRQETPDPEQRTA